MGLLYTFADYRQWSLLTTLMAAFCLPVDILIFYKEPVGIWGTLLAPLSFIPFCVMCADAMFPDKEVLVKGLGRKPVFQSRVRNCVLINFRWQNKENS